MPPTLSERRILKAVDRLRAALAGDDGVTLDEAALDLARIEFAGLDPVPHLAQLDDCAAELARRLPANATGADYVSAANEYLFGELGYTGNESEYHNPKNSCLNWVMEMRTGLPITLSVVYLEIARRLGRPVFGIGLPGHFIVEYRDPWYQAYIDVFHRGTIIGTSECFELMKQSTGVAQHDPALLATVGKQAILFRMLHNLRSSYVRIQSYRKALNVVTLLTDSEGTGPDLVKLRAMLNLKLHRYLAAKNDFERYLRMEPEAEDRREIEEQIRFSVRGQASLN
jgi:regulator of sirC expression with transglutaminase-like and TPR domain